MSARCVFVGAFLLATAGCIGPGRLPHAVLPPIAEEYYECSKCGSLHGGIYGKGPLARFSTKDAAACWHHWQEISKTAFQQKAAAKFPSEWIEVAPYLREPPKL